MPSAVRQCRSCNGTADYHRTTCGPCRRKADGVCPRCNERPVVEARKRYCPSCRTPPAPPRKCRGCGCSVAHLHKSVRWCQACQGTLKIQDRSVAKYGIKSADYERMLAAQGGKCAICRTDQCDIHSRFAVDHNHETGVVRGLLCHRCNLVLGNARDNADLLVAAAAYLTREK